MAFYPSPSFGWPPSPYCMYILSQMPCQRKIHIHKSRQLRTLINFEHFRIRTFTLIAQSSIIKTKNQCIQEYFFLQTDRLDGGGDSLIIHPLTFRNLEQETSIKLLGVSTLLKLPTRAGRGVVRLSIDQRIQYTALSRIRYRKGSAILSRQGCKITQSTLTQPWSIPNTKSPHLTKFKMLVASPTGS